MKKKVFIGLGILLTALALAFAAPSYEQQQEAKHVGYEWGYYHSRYNPNTNTYGKKDANKAADDRGYTEESGLQVYFRDGAEAGYRDKHAGKEFNNPYTVTINYIYNY
ncbi:MAG: hypothetical protein ILP07_09320 [Treponema sp.]|nr:hypothetical protein [Treponema sp.]